MADQPGTKGSRGFLKSPIWDGPDTDLEQSSSRVVAPVLVRAYAAWLNLVIVGVGASLIRFVDVGAVRSADATVAIVVFLVSTVLYRRRGADLGKLIVGLRTVPVDSLEPLSWGQSAIRSLLPLVLVPPVALMGSGSGLGAFVMFAFVVLSLVVMMRSPLNQSITEIVAKTVTVDQDPD